MFGLFYLSFSSVLTLSGRDQDNKIQRSHNIKLYTDKEKLKKKKNNPQLKNMEYFD